MIKPENLNYMKTNSIVIFFIFLLSCSDSNKDSIVITSDIDNFWIAYDEMTKTTDSIEQLNILDSLYISKASDGLKLLIDSKNYTSSEYVSLIRNYPLFWKSIRKNTFKVEDYKQHLSKEINSLEEVYPNLRPASIYFTIGCMRSNGTTRDSLVLIGSELAMMNQDTDISEFEGRTKEWLERFIKTDPLDNLVLLNIHEYVHTQQNPITEKTSLIYKSVYEGVAEFVSTLSMNIESSSPAINYGQNNNAVRDKFQEEAFLEKDYEWLWSSYPNEFDVRDLGYYIGFEIARIHYETSSNKELAIIELLDLNFTNNKTINKFIDGTNFFGEPVDSMRFRTMSIRPFVSSITEFENNSNNVGEKLSKITTNFSKKMNGYSTGLDYSELGESGFPEVTNRYWSQDSLSWTMEVKVQSKTNYRYLVNRSFRTNDDIPLIPYMINFTTK